MLVIFKPSPIWSRLIFFSISLFVSGPLLSQEFTITNLSFVNNQVQISYDLLDSIQGRTYTVQVYSSYDNYITPLSKVSGDAGFEVVPGKNRKIVWDAKSELGEFFEGQVALEIRARIFVPFISTESFAQYKHFKRKRVYNLTWAGGRGENVLNFDLYKGDKKVHTFPNIANVGHFKMEIPNFVKPGKDYWFRISDSRNKDEVVTTPHFRISRRVPLIVKVVGTMAVSAVVYVVSTTLSSNEGSNASEKPDDIPDPVDPNN